MKESAALFKRTWGEQVVGNAGMGIAFFLAFMSLVASGVLALVLAAPLYRLATTGEAGYDFDSGILGRAFVPRKR